MESLAIGFFLIALYGVYRLFLRDSGIKPAYKRVGERLPKQTQNRLRYGSKKKRIESKVPRKKAVKGSVKYKKR